MCRYVKKKAHSEWELIDFRLTSRLKSELTYLVVILLMNGCHVRRNINLLVLWWWWFC